MVSLAICGKLGYSRPPWPPSRSPARPTVTVPSGVGRRRAP